MNRYAIRFLLLSTIAMLCLLAPLDARAEESCEIISDSTTGHFDELGNLEIKQTVLWKCGDKFYAVVTTWWYPTGGGGPTTHQKVEAIFPHIYIIYSGSPIFVDPYRQPVTPASVGDNECTGCWQ